MAEPARSRRSARTAPTPVQASADAQISRSELRRRVTAPVERPSVIWGEKKDAATPAPPPVKPDAAVAVPAPVTEPARAVDAPASSESQAPLTRRARRLATGQTPIIPSTPPEAVSTAAIALPATASFSVPAPASKPQSEPEAAPQRAPEPAASTSVPEPEPAASTPVESVDEFEAAARLFSFTGETPVQRDENEFVAERVVEDEPEKTAPASKKKHKAPRRRATTRTSLKRMATASATLGAIVAVGLLAVGTTMPAEAVAAVDQQLTGVAPNQQAGDVTASSDDEIQAYVAPGDAQPVAGELDRTSNYSTATLVEMAGTTGISNASSAVFTNNPLCDVQWPFAVGVSISYGFGPRPGEFHEGVDFTPGNGAHVQAIADGTVRVAQEGYQGYGVAVIIDHVIDGQHVASLYGHMQYGSLQVHAGEKVKVGQYIGRTGNTGYSFGAHTHVEIRQNGVTPIDPLPWLRAHNKC